MDFPCESEINVRNDNALRFSIITKPAPVIEYLKTIASIIGASHILGVFEDGDFIKVYFDDKKIVDTLIRSGIHVMGHHIKIEYVVPPGSKVILSNIDPLVSNYDLIRLMSMFGSVVSPVFRSPISNDIELCHIDHGVRYLYMNINIPVPETLEFKYGDEIFQINAKLEETLAKIHVKKEPDESNISESLSNTTPSVDNIEQINIDDNIDSNNVADDLGRTDPIVVSVQSATEEISQEQQNEIPELHDETKTRPAKFINSYQTNKKIRPNVKFRTRRTKKFRINKKELKNVTRTSVKQSSQTTLNEEPLSSISLSPEDSIMELSDVGESFMNEDTKSILDKDKLNLFLEEVRCHREPIEIVKKYVGPDSDDLRCLIKQLIKLKKKSEDNAFKVRMRRLINNLKISLDV